MVRAISSRPAKVRSKTRKDSVFTVGNSGKIGDCNVSVSRIGSFNLIFSRRRTRMQNAALCPRLAGTRMQNATLSNLPFSNPKILLKLLRRRKLCFLAQERGAGPANAIVKMHAEALPNFQGLSKRYLFSATRRSCSHDPRSAWLTPRPEPPQPFCTIESQV